MEREVNGYSSVGMVLKGMLSKAFLDALRKRIQELRPLFETERKDPKLYPFAAGRDVYRGIRFNDDEAVMDRIVSGIARFWQDHPEEVFATCLPTTPPSEIEAIERHNVDEWVRRGLLESASSDHWYMFEKDYGDEHDDTAEQEDDNE